MRCGWFAALLACGTLVPAADLRLTSDPLVRNGVLFRCSVNGEVAAEARFLNVALLDGGLVLAARELELSSAQQLARGITVVLAPSQAAAAPIVQVRVSDAERRPLLRQQLAVEGTLRSAPSGPTPPTDAESRLLSEQLAELQQIPVPTLAQQALATALNRRLAGGAPAEGPLPLAVPDPVDGSVQPARLHGVPGTAAARPLAILLRPLPGQTKSAWTALPPAWLAAADQAGIAVLEVYPAGDLTLSGVARRRVAQAEAQARLAMPGLQASWPIVAHSGLAEPDAWRRATPLPSLPTTAGRLADWASEPFVVVVGTGEHAAARADNRQLADAFVRAWAAHAHGLPPVVLDSAFAARAWSGHQLVLIGSPRSNSVLRQRVPTLPVTWDDRSIRVGDRVCQRAYRPALALAVVDPQAAGRTLLVLDGAPAWGAPLGELPLQAEAATADLVLRPGQPAEGPVVRLLLEPQASRP
jgi:hypothetical protein